MSEKNRNSLKFILLTLTLIFTFAFFYLSIEVPLIINDILLDINPDIHPGLEPERVASLITFLIPIGLICLIIVVILIILGFIIKKRKITFLGSFLLFLPTFGQFLTTMLFLAGIGILQVIYLPLLNSEFNFLDLGYIINIPILTFDIIFYSIRPASSFTYIFRELIIFSGLLIFFFGVLAWFKGKISRSDVFDSSVYKYSRHPQYLGFLIWSYGVHSLSVPVLMVPMGANWISFSLPWVVTALIVLSVAFLEDIKMKKMYPEKYGDYQSKTPFLLPLPKFLNKVIAFPLKITFKKEFPENWKEILFIVVFYGLICVLISFILIIKNVDGLLEGIISDLFWSY